MSIRTRLRTLESKRREANTGFSRVRANPDGTYTMDGVRYPNRDALQRMTSKYPGYIFYFTNVPEPAPLPPELAPHRPRRGAFS